MHEDAILNRKIFFDLSKVTSAKVGRKNPSKSWFDQPQITLGGVGIQMEHCVFETNEDGTYLVPLDEKAVSAITINGMKLTTMNKVKLTANDRIIFGNSTAFLFRNQDRAADAKV